MVKKNEDKIDNIQNFILLWKNNIFILIWSKHCFKDYIIQIVKKKNESKIDNIQNLI